MLHFRFLKSEFMKKDIVKLSLTFHITLQKYFHSYIPFLQTPQQRPINTKAVEM